MKVIFVYLLVLAVLLCIGVITAFLVLLNIVKDMEKRIEREKDNDNGRFY